MLVGPGVVVEGDIKRGCRHLLPLHDCRIDEITECGDGGGML